MSDWLAIVISFIYVFAWLGVAEWLRKTFHYSPNFTRKVVHITVGMWSVGTVLLFENRWMAIIPPATFILLNYLSYRKETFKAMESSDKTNLGTVYFPLAFCLIILLLWDRPDRAVAALMPLTWGDAMAGVLGKQYGQIKYTVWGYSRSVEGSVSMAFFSFASTFLALWLLPPPTALLASLGMALVVTLAATGVEAGSPWGIDNLLVPAVSGLILYFW
jgi:phytol kinase